MPRFSLLLLTCGTLLFIACTYDDGGPEEGGTVADPGADYAPFADDDDDDGAAMGADATFDLLDGSGDGGGALFDGHETDYDEPVEPEDDPDPGGPEDFFGFRPWELNVVVIEDMGEPCNPYCSDFQGAAAVGGDAYVSGFSINDLDASPTDMALYVGGELAFTGAVTHGGVEVAGDFDLAGASVDGSVVGGGDLDGSGHIGGDLTLAGESLAGYSISVSGAVTEFEPFVATLDHHVLGVYFRAASSVIAGKTPTTTAVDNWGLLEIEVEPGMNIIEIDAQTLDDAWGVHISGPADASAYIDVPDSSVTLGSLVWSFSGGVSGARTVLNFDAATELNLSGGDHQANFLAPNALVNFPSGLVTGNLIAGELQGCGQVNLGGFEGDPWEDKKY